MQDIQKELAKYVSLYEEGFFGEPQIVNATLYLLTMAEGEEQVVALLELLPNGGKKSVLDRLETLKESGFQWHPLRIGASWSEEELEEIQRGLRFAYGVVCNSE